MTFTSKSLIAQHWLGKIVGQAFLSGKETRGMAKDGEEMAGKGMGAVESQEESNGEVARHALQGGRRE